MLQLSLCWHTSSNQESTVTSPTVVPPDVFSWEHADRILPERLGRPVHAYALVNIH